MDPSAIPSCPPNYNCDWSWHQSLVNPAADFIGSGTFSNLLWAIAFMVVAVLVCMMLYERVTQSNR